MTFSTNSIFLLKFEQLFIFMKIFLSFFIPLIISFSGVSQIRNESEYDKTFIKNLIDSVLTYNRQIKSSRVASIDYQYLLDTTYENYYNGIDNDMPTDQYFTKHLPDEYGHDTLSIKYRYYNGNWIPSNKYLSKTMADGSYDIDRHEFYWDLNFNDWYLANDYYDFRSDHINQDSTWHLSYDIDGSMNSGYKSFLTYNDLLQPIIKIQQNYFTLESLWRGTLRSQYFYNPDGLYSKQIHEQWNMDMNKWENYQLWEYDRDSTGFEYLKTEYIWDSNLQNWTLNALETSSGEYAPNSQKVFMEYNWNAIDQSWDNDRKTIYEYNQNQFISLIDVQYWSKAENLWIPNLYVEFHYNEEFQKQSVVYIKNNFNYQEFLGWTQQSKVEYEYYSNGYKLSETGYQWDNLLNKYVINNNHKYLYQEKKILNTYPQKLDNPTGPDTICINSVDVVYKSKWDTDIKSFSWIIIPEEAGIYEISDSLMSLNINQDYTGPLGIAVAGVNGYGIGEYSDTLGIFIKPFPENPVSPSGPEELNQFSGEASYMIEKIDFAEEYKWKIIPESSGVVNANLNEMVFTLNNGFEGSIEISVQTSNNCGASNYSEPLNVNAMVITTLNESPNSFDINLYPNPTKNQIKIFYRYLDSINNLQIVDLNGKSIYKGKFVLINNEEAIVDFNIPPGIYSVLLETEDNILYRKIVIE